MKKVFLYMALIGSLLACKDKTLEEVNQKLAALPESECRMEDILMDW